MNGGPLGLDEDKICSSYRPNVKCRSLSKVNGRLQGLHWLGSLPRQSLVESTLTLHRVGLFAFGFSQQNQEKLLQIRLCRCGVMP